MNRPTVIPSNLLRCMGAEDRARYATAGTIASAAASMLQSDTGEPSQADQRAEKVLQAEIAKALTAAGYLYRKGRTDKPSGMTVGWPDVDVLLPGGRSCFLEVKNARGKLSPFQREMHKRMAALGHHVFVVRSVAHAMEVVRAVGRLPTPVVNNPLLPQTGRDNAS